MNASTIYYEFKRPNKLWLVNNKKEAIDIFCLKPLQSLILFSANITFTPDFQYLTNLIELTIINDNGRIGKYFPVELNELPLRYMNLSNLLELKALPDAFGKNLTSLILSKIPNLEYLPENLFNLTSLFVEQCPKLTYLPPTIVAASDLQDLTITQTGLLDIELSDRLQITFFLYQ
ncbi:unnamed protein product [Didymodactylos carnosus]|uniref:Uncharacterized protein n=1 Tax=Didymodactylos carnosus TaxID=1234261 RepID=A0A813ZYL8_9BILA|nr:unnamed protein product [Didymodactylos carnosus]CAF3686796.1 unnamed protein product [Didymodactylos carnosus]